MKFSKAIKHAETLQEFQEIIAPESLRSEAIPLKIKITFWGGHKITSNYYKGSASMEKITGQMLLFIKGMEYTGSLSKNNDCGKIVTDKIEFLYDEIKIAAKTKNCITQKIYWLRNSFCWLAFKNQVFGKSAATQWNNGESGRF